MIVCGWCAKPTKPGACSTCSRPAELPWTQRGQEPPTVDVKAGRPTLDEKAIRAAWTKAQRDLRAAGKAATLDAIAEALDRSPRTVREWRVRYSLR